MVELKYYFKTENRLWIIFVQIWKILLNVLAYSPIISFVSTLGMALLYFLLSLIFTKNTSFYILEIIICLFLIGFYSQLLSKKSLSKIVSLTYWFISISTLIIFFLTDFQLVIIFQFALILVYAFNYINLFEKLRYFLSNSSKVLAFMNAFDGIFCGILIYFLHNLYLVESALNVLFKIFYDHYGINENQMSNLISNLLVLILPFILSVLKTIVSIRIFKKLDNIYIPKEKTLWNVYVSMIFISLFLYNFCLGWFFYRASISQSVLYLDILSFSCFIGVNMPLGIAYNFIGYSAKDKKEVRASWLTGTICILLLAVFNQIESELINALTWFLPILIPSLIGEINSQFDTNKHKKKPIRTEKMDRHLYRT